MANGNPRHPKLSSYRSIILDYHRALFAIDDAVLMIDANMPLTDFEKYVIALEDRRFFDHYGVSWRAIARAVALKPFRRNSGGGSTIDMQLFRTAAARYERTIGRKIFEIVGASILQFHYSKLQILRAYLFIAYFGTGLTGSAAAASAMFGKSLADLDKHESAQLAATLVYPKPRVASANWTTKVHRRAGYAKFVRPRLEQQFRKLPR